MSEFETNGYEEELGEGYQETSGSGSDGKKKKKNVKRKKSQKTGEKAGSKLSLAMIAIAAAFIVFVVLIMIESKLVNEEETTPVVVAIAEVPEGLYLDETNMPNYFAIEYRAVAEVPEGVVTYSNGSGMIGLITDRTIRIKEIVTSDCFYEEDFYEGIEDPVELAINLNSIGQTVGGVLRAGDYVDIKAVIKVDKSSLLNGVEGGLLDIENGEGLLDIETTEGLESVVTEQDASQVTEPVKSQNSDTIVVGESGVMEDDGIMEGAEISYGVTGDYISHSVAENVRVVRVFTSGGETTELVESNGGQMIATVINVVVPRYMADAILIAQEEGTITLTRVEDPFYGKENVDETVNETVEGTEENSDVAVEVDGQVSVVQ